MSEKEEKTAPDVRHPEDRTLGMAFLRETIEKCKAKLMEPGKTLGPMAVTWLLDGIVDRLCVLESMLHGDGEWRKHTRWPMVQEWLKKAEGAGVESETVTDCNGLGNAAKLREALESICARASIGGEFDPHAYLDEIHAIANEALAEPPRNCDRFATYAKCIEYWRTHARPLESSGNWEIDGKIYPDMVPWLFAPAMQEGGEA